MLTDEEMQEIADYDWNRLMRTPEQIAYDKAADLAFANDPNQNCFHESNGDIPGHNGG